ncbi:MAG TPA: FadR family transcriptional regulator [Candidatus Faecivivens stercoripullorum]|uniref:FadR family transcriptional regulator n=1 Tax=Candidatus Faecivivens stercoripullorum TaxID=2840805 RepID=A0A9D1KSZ2_9FIRM|nr:FadR family transcriptional regulator [Candidatus Faecivivens stercoripullorum]
MMKRDQSLAERTADDILSMLNIEKRFSAGDRLPSENELANELGVSRTTLREAVRLLAAHQVLVTERGRGTFVRQDFHPSDAKLTLESMTPELIDVRDLFEMRLIFEPEAAYYAAQRATDAELERIRHYAELEEELIAKGEDRAEVEMAFHNSIATATHNSFIGELVPLIYRSIDRALRLSGDFPDIIANVVEDNRLLIEFLTRRNAEGARSAMRIHIIHAMDGLDNGVQTKGDYDGGTEEKNHL